MPGLQQRNTGMRSNIARTPPCAKNGCHDIFSSPMFYIRMNYTIETHGYRYKNNIFYK